MSSDTLAVVFKVVEIVDRYETECIPEASMDDKLGYIRNPLSDKTCNRTIRVSSLVNLIHLSFFSTLVICRDLCLDLSLDKLTSPISMYRCQNVWNSQFMYIISLTTSSRTTAGQFLYVIFVYNLSSSLHFLLE